MMLYRLAVQAWETSYLEKQKEAKQLAIDKAKGIVPKKAKKQEVAPVEPVVENKTKPMANVLDSGSEDEDSEIEEVDDGINSADESEEESEEEASDDDSDSD